LPSDNREQIVPSEAAVLKVLTKIGYLSCDLKYHYCVHGRKLPYFPAHKTHREFFIKNFRKKNNNTGQ